MPKKRHWFFDSSRYKVRVGTGGEYPNGHIIRTHAHPWHQLTFAPRGVMTVRTPDGAWIVPPHRAVWVPARTRHTVEMSGSVLMQALYIAPRFGASLSNRCRVLEVSALLRELILRVADLKWLDVRIAGQAHIASLLLDEIRVMEAQSDAIHLPLPRDARAKRIAALLRETPADARPLAQLARLAGASKRTVERVFKRELGFGFGKWRQQLRLGHALRLLAAGDAVTNVAPEVGYQSPSAFIAAFRMTFGHTPGQYFRAGWPRNPRMLLADRSVIGRRRLPDRIEDEVKVPRGRYVLQPAHLLQQP